MKPQSAKTTILFVLVALSLLAGGCGGSKKITITQYPVFWDSAPKSIAVVPFSNSSTGRNAGKAVSEELVMALTQNGTYKVYDREKIKHLLAEAELREALSDDVDQAASQMVKVKKVDSLLTGSVGTYAATSRREQRQNPIYGKKGRIIGYNRFTFHHNEATVVATATLTKLNRSGSHSTIHSATKSATVKSEGQSPSLDPFGCLASARRQVVHQLLAEFAVLRTTIKVKQKNVFFTASGQPYDGKWPKTKKFSANADKMIVVLKLPPNCDRNRFRITVVRKAKDDVPVKDLVTVHVKWTRSMSATGKQIVLSPKKIAQAGSGPGKYTLKLYSGPAKPALKQDFTLEGPK